LLNYETVFGMMNIGFNPTVNGEKKSIEIHFFNWITDLYNQEIQVNIHERIRDEQKFNSIDELKVQLEEDKITSQYVINTMKL
jgi:riboflavin kinase/FMN adenylyltransferase